MYFIFDHRDRGGNRSSARVEAEASGKPARRFRDFVWSTLDSWSRRRRVVGKAEWTGGAANPRFVVTSLKPAQAEARHLYETIYCARSEMDNRIKECQLDLVCLLRLCPALRCVGSGSHTPSSPMPHGARSG